MLAFKLAPHGCLCVSSDQTLEHSGWFSESASWNLQPSASGLHQLRSHSSGLYLTLCSGQLSLGSAGVDADWRVETHPNPSPTVHQIAAPLAAGEDHPALQGAWRSDQCRGLLAVPGILSGHECEQLIHTAESVGFSPEREGVRQNEMVQIRIPAESLIHRAVAARLLPLLPRSPGGARAVGLNPRWRFYRYRQDDQFLAHYDQSSELDQNGQLQRSRMSVLLYLTAAVGGGGTRFWTPSAGQWMATTITPPAGTAICFWHGDHADSPLHEGCALNDPTQTKIVIRSDIMWATCGTNDSSSQS